MDRLISSFSNSISFISFICLSAATNGSPTGQTMLPSREKNHPTKPMVPGKRSLSMEWEKNMASYCRGGIRKKERKILITMSELFVNNHIFAIYLKPL